MTTSQSPRLAPPSLSVNRRPTLPAAPKLRDSCHACASSKLKCLKEKPTCSRCAKRALTCEYVATKRVCRKQDVRSSNKNSDSTSSTINEGQLLTPLSLFAPSSSISSTNSLPSSSKIRSPGPSTSNTSFNLFPSLLSPVEQPLSSASADPTTELNDFCGSPIAFSLPDISDTDILSQAHPFPLGVDNSNNDSANFLDPFPGFDSAVSELFALSHPHSPSNSRASSTSEARSYQSSHTNESGCLCLVSALGLMKQLFPSHSTACTASAMQRFDKPINPPTIQTVIAKNEQTIEAVSTMLQCSCSQDSYLLAIMSLIVFKMLGWYAAAARRMPPSSDDLTSNHHNIDNHSVRSSHTSHSRHQSYSEQVLQDAAVVGNYCLDGEDSARMAAQLVLSELHRVQHLVNQLSAKLKVQVARNSGLEAKGSSSGFDSPDNESTLPFSTEMLSRLEIDLRKRLKALSLEIVEGLKRE